MLENELTNWAKCEIEGCSNKCCLALNSPLCHPHTKAKYHPLLLKEDWPAFKLDAIKAFAKKMMGREFPFIDGRTGQAIPWIKKDEYSVSKTFSYSVSFGDE